MDDNSQSQPMQQPQPAPQQPGGNQRPPLRIDHNLLAELGLAALPDQEKKDLEKHIYETLEMRVGMRLADQMTNEQLDEFETYFNARDDAGAFRWLESNFPNYKDIVAEEFEKLKDEVRQNAPHILSASQAEAGQARSEQAQVGYEQPNLQTGSGLPSQPAQQPQYPEPPMPPQPPQSPQPGYGPPPQQ